MVAITNARSVELANIAHKATACAPINPMSTHTTEDWANVDDRAPAMPKNTHCGHKQEMVAAISNGCARMLQLIESCSSRQEGSAMPRSPTPGLQECMLAEIAADWLQLPGITSTSLCSGELRQPAWPTCKGLVCTTVKPNQMPGWPGRWCTGSWM